MKHPTLGFVIDILFGLPLLGGHTATGSESEFLLLERLGTGQVRHACVLVDACDIGVGQHLVDLHRSTDQPVASHVRVGLVAVVAAFWNLVSDVGLDRHHSTLCIGATLGGLSLPVHVIGHLDFGPCMIGWALVGRGQ